VANTPVCEKSPTFNTDRLEQAQHTTAALERLASDLHALIFDIQETATHGHEIRNAREGRRIAAAIRQVFHASP
jgi:hypothetical protein